MTPGPGTVVVHRELVITRGTQPSPALLDLYMAARRVTTIQVTSVFDFYTLIKSGSEEANYCVRARV